MRKLGVGSSEQKTNAASIVRSGKFGVVGDG